MTAVGRQAQLPDFVSWRSQVERKPPLVSGLWRHGSARTGQPWHKAQDDSGGTADLSPGLRRDDVTGEAREPGTVAIMP
jgi:hypothetical protein